MSFDVQVTGGAFAGASWTFTFSGDPARTFYTSNGDASGGTYSYTKTGPNTATLVLDYKIPVEEERTTMLLNFNNAASGSYTGTERLLVGNGEFSESANLAGTFGNLRIN